MVNSLRTVMVVGLLAVCIMCFAAEEGGTGAATGATAATSAGAESTAATGATGTTTGAEGETTGAAEEGGATREAAAGAAEDTAAAPAVDQEIVLGVGVLHQDISGNERRFDQYVIPPSELFLSRLRWRRYDITGGPSLDLDKWDVDSPGGYGSLWLNWGRWNAEALYRDSSFYYDFEPDSLQSHRRDFAARLFPLSRADRRLTWQVAGNNTAWGGMSFGDLQEWEDSNRSASVGYRTGSYWLDLGFNREDFDVRTGQFFSGDTKSYMLALSPIVGQRLQWSGNLARHVTDLNVSGREVKSTAAQMTMQYPLSAKSDLTGSLRYFNIDETITQNAYADSQLRGKVELEYRPGRRTQVSAFWVGTTTDYVDGRQAFTVETTSNLFGVRGSARLSPDLKVKAAVRHQENNDLPLAYNLDGTLASTLIWTDLTWWDVSASYTPGARWGATADFQHRRWRNAARDTSNTFGNLAVTAWWQALRRLMLTGSWIRQDFNAPFVDIVTLRRFASDITAVVVGANYQLSERSTVYASFTHTDASDYTDNLYDRFTIGATHEVGRRDRVLAELNFHEYSEDLRPLLAYEADLYRLEWEHEF